MRYLITFLTIMISLMCLRAQTELSVLGSSHLLQSDLYNPANFDNQGWHFALPSVLFDFYHTGPGYHDLIKSEKGNAVLKVSSLAPNLQDQNFLYSNLRIQTFKIKYGYDKWSFGFDHEIVFNSAITYPGDLVRLYLDGNQPFIGQTIDIAPTVHIASYNSYGFSISHQWSNFTFGIRPKILFGNHFGNSLGSADLSTSDDVYQITLRTDYQFQNVGLLSFNDGNFLNYQVQSLDQWNFLSPNVGTSIDMGIKWNLSSKFTFQFSILDWGSITWKNAETYISQETTTYEGGVISDVFGTQTLTVDGTLDSLKTIFDLKVEQRPIHYELPVKWIGAINYQITPGIDLSLISVYQRLLDRPLVMGVQANILLAPQWKIGATVSNHHSQGNLGFIASWIRPKWIGFIATDQVLKGLNPLKSNHYNWRLGVNLHFKGTSFN
ncbi:MAG: hypothetical protein KDC53_02865 [Saprospiraceae bacterium]|nr:hypothetical protein [Saprospiraceae bacterium]